MSEPHPPIKASSKGIRQPKPWHRRERAPHLPPHPVAKHHIQGQAPTPPSAPGKEEAK